MLNKLALHLLQSKSKLLLLAIALVVFAADQASKTWVFTNLEEQQSWAALAMFKGMISITHIVNTGGALGLFPNQGNFFTIIAIVVVIAIISYYRYLPLDQPRVMVSLGLQLGGAMGNWIDRVRLGFVVDFIDFGFWPVFNLADLSIIAGVIILASYLMHEEEHQGETHPQAGAAESGTTAPSLRLSQLDSQGVSAGDEGVQGIHGPSETDVDGCQLPHAAIGGDPHG